jgi:hypothetical protein
LGQNNNAIPLSRLQKILVCPPAHCGQEMARVTTILLLKLTRLFGPKVKESLFTRNT